MATKKPTPKKAAKPAADLALHVNHSGRICFGKTAAERINGLQFMTIVTDEAARTMKLIARKDEADDAVAIRSASGRPYISALKQLKSLGFTGDDSLDVLADAIDHNGFSFEVI